MSLRETHALKIQFDQRAVSQDDTAAVPPRGGKFAVDGRELGQRVLPDHSIFQHEIRAVCLYDWRY
jgi:hypothetical protein